MNIVLLSRVKILRPQLLSISKAEGRKVAYDLLSPHGQILLKRGDRIERNHISRLRAFDVDFLPILFPEKAWVTEDRLEGLDEVQEKLEVKTTQSETYRISRVIERSSHLTTVSVLDEYCLHLARVHGFEDAHEKLSSLGERGISLGQKIKKVYSTLSSTPGRSKNSELREALLKADPVPDPSRVDPIPINSPRIHKALSLMKQKREVKSTHLDFFRSTEKLPQTILEEDLLDRRLLDKFPGVFEKGVSSPFSQEVFDNLEILHSRLEDPTPTTDKKEDTYRELFNVLFTSKKETASNEFLKLSEVEEDPRHDLLKIKDFLRKRPEKLDGSQDDQEKNRDDSFFRDVFPRDFMEQYTHFARFKDFLDQSPLDKPVMDPSVQDPDPEWESFVSKYTDFDGWKEMLDTCNSYWDNKQTREERQHPRHTIDCPARLKTGERTQQAQIEDISRSGVGIHTPTDLKKRQMIKITFPVPKNFKNESQSEGVPHLQVLGVVRWVQTTPENITTKAGIEILRKEVVHLDSRLSFQGPVHRQRG